MTEIYDTNETFEFSKLNFLKPVPSIGGNYFIRIRANGSPLYVQPPKCKTKQGIIKAGKKYYTDLVFTNENESFIQWMENLETHCQNVIYDNRETWFDGGLDKHDIENYFTSPLKVFKSGKFYNSRINISLEAGEPTLKIYDENENIIELDAVDDKIETMTILEIQGIRCSAKSFQIDIELKQMMVLKPKDLFNKCVLKTNTSIDAVVPKITKETVTVISGDKSIPTTVTQEKPDTNEYLENTEEIDAPEEESEHFIVESKKLDNEIEEFEVHLEDLSANETIQIKQRNDVYYEMYREAKRKAKIARDLALASYLEAKRIKNLYMLDEIKDSDESDLDTEDDPQDLE